MEQQGMKHEIVWLAETDSTNLEVMRRFRAGAEEGLLVSADQQTAGRGRRGRTWVTPPGGNIAMSLLLKPEIVPDDAPQITLIAAMAVRQAVLRVTGVSGMIKWPNDITVDGKKITGILTEMELAGLKIGCVVVGIGINVNLTEYPPEVAKVASSLKLITGREWDRKEIVRAFLEEFDRYYDVFLQNGCTFAALRQEYDSMLVNCGREVLITEEGREICARAVGVDERGQLIVKLPDDSERHIYAGEVSVRGIYGYT